MHYSQPARTQHQAMDGVWGGTAKRLASGCGESADSQKYTPVDRCYMSRSSELALTVASTKFWSSMYNNPRGQQCETEMF